jgi:transcriptional regulator with XRE-family HTH domain
MPAGRPTEYREAFCDTAVECLKQGYSLTVLAGELDVSRQTIDNWMKAHPEFLDAISRGRAKGARIWEDRLGASADTGAGNATSIAFGLKNLAKDDWRDKTEQELSGPDGGAIPTEMTVRFVRPGD